MKRMRPAQPTNQELNQKLDQIIEDGQQRGKQINEIIKELVAYQQKVNQLDQRTRLLPDHDTYLKHQDMLYRRLDRIEEALVILTGHKDQLEDHEIRITQLESPNHA